MKLIPLDAVLAEIEKLKDEAIDLEDKSRWFLSAALKNRIKSLEVKEVDYDKEVTEYLNNFENANIGHRLSLRRCAKHFFELGMAVSNKALKGE